MGSRIRDSSHYFAIAFGVQCNSRKAELCAQRGANFRRVCESRSEGEGNSIARIESLYYGPLLTPAKVWDAAAEAPLWLRPVRFANFCAWPPRRPSGKAEANGEIPLRKREELQGKKVLQGARPRAHIVLAKANEREGKSRMSSRSCSNIGLTMTMACALPACLQSH